MRATPTNEGRALLGHWQREEAHFPSCMSPHLWDLFVPAYRTGTHQGLARYGSIIRHFEMRRFEGHVYVRPRFVSEPERPDLAERSRLAEDAVLSRLWRKDRDAWPPVREALRKRLLALGRIDPSSLDMAGLGRHAALLREVFVEGTVQHFVRQPASMFPVGDWLRKASGWTGAAPGDLVGLLQGASTGSAASLRAVDAIVEAVLAIPEAVRALGDEDTGAGIRIHRLCDLSTPIAETLTAYMDEYADRIIMGFDLVDLTLREAPGVVLATISSRLSSRSGTSRSGTRDRACNAGSPGAGLAVVSRFCRRVPPEHRAEFDEGLEEARLAYGLHDEDLGVSYLWPLGLLRRTMLEAAGRLVGEHALEDVEDIFQTTPCEFDALLSGHRCPSAGELRQRKESFASQRGQESPRTIEGGGALPVDEWLTPASRRVHQAILYYLEQMNPRAPDDPRPAQPLRQIRGIAASAGCYEGRSRVVADPWDVGTISRGDILVAQTLSSGFNLFLPIVGAVVTDRGGALCHAAIVAREFGIPAVVGTGYATAAIPDGARVRVDGSRGIVDIERR